MSRDTQVLALGWYGAGNAGDEWLLRLFRDWCVEAGARVVAASVDPAYTRATHGIDAIDAHELPAIARAMRDSDLFALGGGGLFNTHYEFTLPALYDPAPGDLSAYARPVLMARQMGVPALLWAQGVGPLQGNDARAIVRDLFQHASYASVRDEASRALLSAIGVERAVLCAPDPLWAMPLPDSRPVPAQRETIAIVVRPWESAPQWQEHLLAALNAGLDPQRHRLLWIPFQPHAVPGRSASDAPLARELMQRLDPRLEQTLFEDADLDAIARALVGSDRVIAMRLHAQVLALRAGRPVLAVEYDAKMSEAAVMAQMPAALRLAPVAGAARWSDALQRLLACAPGGAAQADLELLAEDALRHRDLLHEAIGACDARARGSRWDAGQFDWLSTWRDGAQERIASLQAALALRDEAAVRSAQWLEQSAGSVALLRSLNATLQDELQQREAVLATERERGDALVAQISALDDDNAQLRESLGAARQELSMLHGAHALASEQARVASAQLDEIRHSHSWRLTAPLRFASRLWRGPNAERRALLGQAAAKLGPRGNVASRNPAIGAATGAAITGDRGSVFDWVALADAATRVAIVPSAFEFDELANQRPINLAKYLAARGYTVVFAAWQWSRGERLLKSGSEVHSGVWQVDLYDLLDRGGALRRRGDDGSLFVLTLPAPSLVALHRPLRRCGFAVLYDILDEWEAFALVGQAPWFDARAEHEAVLAADAVAAVSPPLAEKFASLRSDIQVIGNGYSPLVLGEANALCARAARPAGESPVIGYFGHLTDAWFDWNLVLAAAARMPQARFELIGYGEPDWVRESAARLPNLRLPGKVAPSELWRHAAGWHVALAPFQPGPLASAIDPIKAYEYLYFGLPVVCSGIPHLALLPGVCVAEGVDAFVEACRAQAACTPDYAAMETALRHATWDARFDALLAAVPDCGLRSLYAD